MEKKTDAKEFAEHANLVSYVSMDINQHKTNELPQLEEPSTNIYIITNENKNVNSQDSAKGSYARLESAMQFKLDMLKSNRQMTRDDEKIFNLLSMHSAIIYMSTCPLMEKVKYTY